MLAYAFFGVNLALCLLKILIEMKASFLFLYAHCLVITSPVLPYKMIWV